MNNEYDFILKIIFKACFVLKIFPQLKMNLSDPSYSNDDRIMSEQ